MIVPSAAKSSLRIKKMDIEDAKEAFIDWLTPEANRTLCLIANVLDLDEDLEFDNVKIDKNMFNWWEVGSTKFVFTIPPVRDYVFKIPLSKNSWSRSIDDQCKIEYENYLRAIDLDIEDFFAATKPLNYTLHSCVGDAEIYISPNMKLVGWWDDEWEYGYEDEVLKEAENIAKSYKDAKTFFFDSLSAIAHLIEVNIPKEKTLQLLDFMVQYDISDIHSGNYMLTEDGMVLLDYSA